MDVNCPAEVGRPLTFCKAVSSLRERGSLVQGLCVGASAVEGAIKPVFRE